MAATEMSSKAIAAKIRSAPSVRRRRRHRGAIVALVVIVALLAGSGVAAAIAYNVVKTQANQLQAQLTIHLESAQSELEAAKASLKSANSSHDEAFVSQASVHFTTAKLQFAVARQMADSSRLLKQIEQLPEVGGLATSRQAAVDNISDMGIAISDAGLELASLEGQLIKPPGAGGQEGRTLLTVLNQASSSLVIVRKDLGLAQTAAAKVDLQILPAAQQASFVKAKGTIGSAIASADEFARLVPIMNELLGGNGARTYLIEQVNPAELRPGGGFIGTYSVLQANQGSLTLVRSGNATDLIGTRAAPGGRGYVTPPGPLREFIPNTSWSFIDSNFFPDFASNASAGEMFAQPYLSSHIDGVIAFDYYAVAKMLELTGPLPVPGYRITLTSTNFVPLVVQSDILAPDPSHKAMLAAVAGPLMQRISTLPPAQWPALLGALNDLAAARHLQAYFNNAPVEKEIDKVGWSGSLNPGGAKGYMMEVEANLGGTKANYFIVRHYTVELTRSGSVLHHKVTIDITDNMPFEDHPGEYYSAYLRLYVSDTATTTADNLRRARYANPAPPAGTKMIDGWVPLFHGYGHTGEAVFTYDTPWASDGRGESTIYWQKQPGTLNDAITVKWNDGSGHAYSTTGDLGQDRVITFSSRGVTLAAGRAAQAQLPSLSLG
jgi:Protein of unknown function (DUF4012)